MAKKIFKCIILLLVIVGIVLGVSVSLRKTIPNISSKNSEQNVINMVQTRTAELTSFYTYGKALNVAGKISGIESDNFESIKLVIVNGKGYEESYPINHSFDGINLLFESDRQINKGIVIDELENDEYYILVRLKLNNSTIPKYYSFVNKSDYQNIDYFTFTKDSKNLKADINFKKETIGNKDYNFMMLSFEEKELPQNIYDVVIDAGHGGKDVGESFRGTNEAKVTLEYAKLLKSKLEEKGLKVFLTRDDQNSMSYTYTNMYSANGRITTACESKAKLMISLHLNNNKNAALSGLEVYSPCKSELSFAKKMANNIVKYTGINYSNNSSFKVDEGVYVRNFTKKVISEYAATANKKGYEPYNITVDTPYLFTIREVGGVATNAYVDGRNTDYNANYFYNYNHGIECYQVEMGYVKSDYDIIENKKEEYVNAIVDAIVEKY